MIQHVYVYGFLLVFIVLWSNFNEVIGEQGWGAFRGLFDVQYRIYAKKRILVD